VSRPQSLRYQLLLRLALPLALVVCLDAALSYFVALHYADQAYDRWLLDSARSLAQQVKTKKDKVTFDLPPIAVEVFRWDDVDKTFFKVESTTSGFMAGDKALPSPDIAALEKERPYFSDVQIQGKPVRAVSVLTAPTTSAEDVLVSVAETLNKRRGMMGEILLAVLLPQVLLLLISGLHIWTGINRGLRPLRDLARAIARRSGRQLEPIPDSGVPLEVRALTDTINALLQKLAGAMAAQQRFVENAAHQLRTPLAGLKIQAERALRANDRESLQPALTYIKSSADQVSHLSTQLLVLARSESVQQGPRHFKALDLTRIARDCCMEWVPKALERDMDLAFDAPAEAVSVAGSATLLRELLGNLLDNAIRYGNRGGHVVVSVNSEPAACLKVEDDGPGISEQESSKVFERFYRIPGTPGKGCGLGLAIVHEIADLHGADVTISAAERPPGGTCVQVLFPNLPTSP